MGNPRQDLGEFHSSGEEESESYKPGRPLGTGLPNSVMISLPVCVSVSVAGERLQWGQSLDPCFSPEASTVPKLSRKGRRERGGSCRRIMGSLEAVLITLSHSLLSRAYSHGPTELQGSLGNVIFLHIQDRNGTVLLSVLSLSSMPYSSQL